MSWRGITFRSRLSEIDHIERYLRLQVMFFDHNNLCGSLRRKLVMRDLDSVDTRSGHTAEHGRLGRGTKGCLSHGALHTNQHHNQCWVDTLSDKHD